MGGWGREQNHRRVHLLDDCLLLLLFGVMHRYSERGQLTHAPEDTREIDAQGEVGVHEMGSGGQTFVGACDHRTYHLAFSLPNTQAWRVEWNVLGTVLASSGDDGVVKLWRKKRRGGEGDGAGGEAGEWVLSKVVSEPSAGDGLILLDN